MPHNVESNMPSADAVGYGVFSRQGVALHFGKTMFERFWIKQTPPVETCLIDCVSYKYIPASFTEGFYAGRMTLVRPEYEEIWARLKCDVSEGALKGKLVWGSSGAGKSIALLFLLVQCLHNRMSVAISYREGSHLIFDATGVHACDDLFPNGSSTLVVLQDSFSLAPMPYELYRPTARTYVVQATSPQLCRYKTFVKECVPAVFVMTPWRREELAALLTIDPEAASTTKDMYSTLDIYDYVGPSLKTVLPARILKSGNIDLDLEELLRGIKSMLASTPAEHWSMSDSEICTFIEAPNPPTAYHQLFSIYPSTSAQDKACFGIESRHNYVLKIPTSYLRTLFFSMVTERALKDHVAWVSRFTAAPAVGGTPFETLDIIYLAYAMSPSRIFFQDEELGDLIPAGLPQASDVLRLGAVPEAGLLHLAKNGSGALTALWEQPDSGMVYLMSKSGTAKHLIAPDGVAQVINAYGDSKTLEDFVFVFVVPSKVIGVSVVAMHGEGIPYTSDKPCIEKPCSARKDLIRVAYLVIDTPRVQSHKRIACEIRGEGSFKSYWPPQHSWSSGSKRAESSTVPSTDKAQSDAPGSPSSNKKAKSAKRSRVVSQPSML